MAIFAIAWNSFASDANGQVSYVLRLAPKDFLLLAAYTGVVVALITVINWKIPVRFAVVRLSFFSILLYASLFLTYGRGFTMASQAMVFGILIYLTFGAGQLSELARRISLHDVDPKLAESFEEIITHHDALQNLKDETQLKRTEHEVIASKRKLEIEIKQSESDLSLSQQFADMRTKKVELTKQMNEVQLSVLETKIGFLSDVFGVLSKEMHLRLSSAIPKQIEDLKKNVGTLTPEEIRLQMGVIIEQINSSLQGIPESLAELRTQLLETSTEIEQATRLLVGRSNEMETPAEHDEVSKNKTGTDG